MTETMDGFQLPRSYGRGSIDGLLANPVPGSGS
jgi:hypothetical protein